MDVSVRREDGSVTQLQDGFLQEIILVLRYPHIKLNLLKMYQASSTFDYLSDSWKTENLITILKFPASAWLIQSP